MSKAKTKDTFLEVIAMGCDSTAKGLMNLATKAEDGAKYCRSHQSAVVSLGLNITIAGKKFSFGTN